MEMEGNIVQQEDGGQHEGPVEEEAEQADIVPRGQPGHSQEPLLGHYFAFSSHAHSGI